MRNTRPDANTETAVPGLLLVGQHHDLSAALSTWLSASIARCRVLTAQTGEEGIEAVRTHCPRAVVLSLHLGDMSGIEAARRIKTERPETAVVLFALCDAAAYRSEAIRAGANGYVLKSRASRDLLPLLRRLLHKGTEPCDGARASVNSTTAMDQGEPT